MGYWKQVPVDTSCRQEKKINIYLKPFSMKPVKHVPVFTDFAVFFTLTSKMSLCFSIAVCSAPSATCLFIWQVTCRVNSFSVA